MKNVHYLVLSDVHVKALPNEQLFMELEQFIAEAIQMEKLDVIFITGDFFHKKVDANTDVSEALKFMHKLIIIAKEKKSKIRIIKGTHSHDLNQLDMFKGLAEVTGADIRVIDSVESEILFPDFEVLYVPEEYQDNMYEYYGKYIYSRSEPYNMILGHGMVDIASFISQVQESEDTKQQAPIFKLDDLKRVCPDGPIYFGHIHKPMKDENFRYVGSYSVWAFGEEENKGFIKGKINMDDGSFKDKFIINELRRRFDTITISDTSTLFNNENPHDIVKDIDALIEELMFSEDDTSSDYVRIKMNIPITYGDSILLSQLLKNTYARNKNVQVLVSSVLQNSKVEEIKETILELAEKYGYLFSDKLSFSEKIAYHIKKNIGRDISVEKIERIIEKK